MHNTVKPNRTIVGARSLILNEANETYSLPEEERSNLAAVGVFQCYAAIGGKLTRRYSLSADGKNLTLILCDLPEDKIPLQRIR